MIHAVAIVVPVHDEEDLLGSCLQSLRGACVSLPPSVASYVVVVLDSCRDASARVVREALASDEGEATEVSYRNVGRSRAHGLAIALERFADVPPGNVWLATTDADSRVPSGWLVDQLGLANGGIDAVAGVVEVDDWGSYPKDRARAYEAFYRSTGGDDHDHVHGANLGVRASVYVAAGGFAPLVTGEDHALWNAVRARGHRSVATRRISVATSARLIARAPRGFASFLDEFRA